MQPYNAKPLKAHPIPKVGILCACDTILDGNGAPKMKKSAFHILQGVAFRPERKVPFLVLRAQPVLSRMKTSDYYI